MISGSSVNTERGCGEVLVLLPYHLTVVHLSYRQNTCMARKLPCPCNTLICVLFVRPWYQWRTSSQQISGDLCKQYKINGLHPFFSIIEAEKTVLNGYGVV